MRLPFSPSRGPLTLLSTMLLLAACSSDDGGEGSSMGDGDGDVSPGDGDTMMGDGDVPGGDGDLGTGGDVGTGGSLATGGDPSTGGDPATGGDVGTGGDPATGGDPGTGGEPGTGGDVGTGGMMEPEPDAVATATIGGINGSAISGTATFTQIDGMVTLVIDLENCPTESGSNPHGTHLHDNNDCSNNGDNAGGHWSSGELIGNIQCDNTTVRHEVSQSTDVWTIGGDGSTDVTQHSLMVHDGPSGTRIGCGEVTIVD